MTKIPLPNTMLVSNALPTIDYSDCFTTQIDSVMFPNIYSFARKYFETQPRWLAMISMNILTKKQMSIALKNNTFTTTDKIGSWKIYLRNTEEIVFGDDMGFMEYRFGMKIKDHTLSVATVVQYKGKFGKFYFSFVKLLHQKFVLLSLTYPLKNKIIPIMVK